MAARIASPTLRSLDAIHLATAVHVQPDAVLTYDERLAGAAEAQGLAVLAPR
jgi:predicted nucleic acid-binding protein